MKVKIRNDQKGFTLAELLIVMAIIGVLVAIAFPIYSDMCEKARITADQANMRSAKAEAAAAYLTDEEACKGKEAWFNAETGLICNNKTEKKNIPAYGKTTQKVKDVSLFGKKNTAPHSGKIIKIVYPNENSPEIQLLWEEP